MSLIRKAAIAAAGIAAATAALAVPAAASGSANTHGERTVAVERASDADSTATTPDTWGNA
ncbi:hypothetical protein ACFOSC_27270 [Streptantibioticus rubrisoli]|uniref:Uncharacterized protein n=1 Tax=Streptantibioticus rubrisoli TaxID=1387313 RepID=A0ABT1PCZ0_9ACTN|nr:hypothetical protein [Streptantibioticus rubrisoli]MCQ4042333.1 hypothetical protein [Streptantibioticus rubrisoli]